MMGMGLLEICSIFISVLLRENDLKTSLQAVKVSISSLDAIIGTGLGKPKNICFQNER